MRTLLFISLLLILVLCLRPVRAWLGRRLRRREFAEIKRNLWIALTIYFLFSVVVSLQECSAFA